MDEAIFAHVNMLAHNRPRTSIGANATVHFAGSAPEAPLDGLGDALNEVRSGSAPLGVCLVLPHGSLAGGRAKVERRLGSLGKDRDNALVITEDYGGRWTSAFGAGSDPATYLLNAQGDFVWHQVGVLHAKSFVGIGRYLLSGRMPRCREVRLALRLGERAPDFLFPLADGRRMALRKLRGRRVLLNFWKSSSAPCRKELLNLLARAQREGLVVVAVNDGEDCERLDLVRRELGLKILLVSDLNRQIAPGFGINCWPTTLTLDAEGRVEDIRLGVTRPKSSKGNDSGKGDPRDKDDTGSACNPDER